MAEAFPANRRQAILVFHFADRVKAELLLASRLLNTVSQMEGQEREGAGRLLVDYLKGLEQEVNLTQLQIDDPEMVRVRTVMTGIIGMADASMYADMQTHLSWMISTMTTYAQRAMEYLVNDKLL
jgi:hypothetical protein